MIVALFLALVAILFFNAFMWDKARNRVDRVLDEIDKFEADWDWAGPVNLDEPPHGDPADIIRYAYATIREKLQP